MVSSMDGLDRDSEDKASSSAEDGDEQEKNPSYKISEYEKQRMSRIAENKARMKALGLSNMASSLMSSSRDSRNRRGKSKVRDDDEDYRPNCDDVEDRDEEEEEEEKEEEEEFLGKTRSGSCKRKNKTSKSKKRASSQKNHCGSEYSEEDHDLMKAIALSLQDSIGEGSSTVHCKEKGSGEEPGSGKKKKSQQFTSRSQMTKDELIIYFYQFDETGKGFISIRDLEKMAMAHDFTWADEELADMIRCFDSDRDGKLSLDDFQKIVTRCRMLKEPVNS